MYFVSLGEGTGCPAVVVKPNKDVAADLMGTQIALACGVRAPKLRLVERGGPEQKKMVERLACIDEARPRGCRCSPPIRQVLAQQPFVVVQEYIRGATLQSVALGTAEEQGEMFMAIASGRPVPVAASARAWAARVLGSSGGPLSEPGARWLRQVGAVIAVDILINNSDRLPCVWDNEGNTENLMLAAAAAPAAGGGLLPPVSNHDDGGGGGGGGSSSRHVFHEPVAIDTMVNCFDLQVRHCLSSVIRLKNSKTVPFPAICLNARRAGRPSPSSAAASRPSAASSMRAGRPRLASASATCCYMAGGARTAAAATRHLNDCPGRLA
eukprot:SAG22_NODE_245_length_13962_cov_11.954555_15_plen_325_part_00